jgi:hypothetical protein
VAGRFPSDFRPVPVSNGETASFLKFLNQSLENPSGARYPLAVPPPEGPAAMSAGIDQSALACAPNGSARFAIRFGRGDVMVTVIVVAMVTTVAMIDDAAFEPSPPPNLLEHGMNAALVTMVTIFFGRSIGALFRTLRPVISLVLFSSE